MLRIGLIAATGMLVSACTAWGRQEAPGPPSMQAVRTSTVPLIDGVPDDSAWNDAAVIDGFTQVAPQQGAAPTEHTEVRVLHDDDNLYIAVRCLDSEPERIVARDLARDGGFIDSDDFVTIILDPFGEKRGGYFFQVNPVGAKRDGLLDPFRGSDRLEWDGIWHAKARRDDHGWTAEFAIPFKTLSFRPGVAWGFNFERVIRKRQETVRWASPRQDVHIRRVDQAGRLENLQGMKQGLGLTLKPYVSTKVDLEDGGVRIKPGADLYFRVTHSVTAAVTVNTDFAETEVDERQVNLTRFPLFFPEKREFFLQDTDIFSFGGIQQSPLPFFSRRIGIVGGEEKEILAGVKVTGRERGVSFGVLDVQMYDDDDLGSKNLAVGRASAHLFDQSNVGVIFTAGDPGTPGDNALAGADLNLRSNALPDGKTVEAHAWIMGTATDAEGSGDDPDDTAFGGRVAYPNDDWSLSLFAAHIGAGFNPALGFVERTGVREYDGRFRRRWRTTGYFRRIDLAANPSLFTELGGELQTLEVEAPEVEVENRNGDEYGAAYVYTRDVLTDDFEITDGVVIPEDDYDFGRGRAWFDSSASRALAWSFVFEGGGYYGGRREDYVPAIAWRPSSQFFASAEYEINDIHLPDGDFIVRTARLRANVLFTPEISWNNTIQWDNESDRLGVNSRFRWEIEPGTDLFVVLNHGFAVEDDTFESEESEFTIKFGMTLRF